MSDFPSSAVIESTIGEILSRPEFQPGLSDRLLRLLSRLLEWLSELFSRTAEFTGGPIGAVVMMIPVLLLFALLIWLIARGQGGESGRPAARAQEIDPAQEAARLAGAGDYGQALSWLFLAHLRELERADYLVVQHSKTGLQYELELAQRHYAGLPEFRALKRLFQAVRYGGQQLDAGTYEHWRAYCASALPAGTGGAP